MQFKTKSPLSWMMLALCIILSCCTELDLNQTDKAVDAKLITDARSKLPKPIQDSTRLSEAAVAANGLQSMESTQALASVAATSVNIAPQAIVSAESTYPGYSVARINDGSRTTTVGPSYSWTNNFPGGGKLPESVFLKFNSLKTIDRIDIYTSSGYAMASYTIQYRTTTTGSWVNLVVVTGNTSVSRTHTFTSLAIREIQIVCQLGPSNQNIYGRLNEVEIYGTSEPTLPYIYVENGMLVFGSDDAVIQAMDYLDFKYDQYSDAFIGQYPGLTDDQLADVEESTGFNDEQPFIDFESQYGISSLRAQVTAAEDNWLNTTAGDETAGTDPDDTYVDEVELRALLNYNGQLKSGSTYYTFLSDGSYYTSTGTPLPVQTLKTMTANKALPANVTYVKPAIAINPTCRSSHKNKGFIPSADGSWRMKWKVKVYDGPFAGPGKAKAITRSYKKKNGHWKKRSSTIGAQVYGTIVAGDCTGGTAIQSQYKERKHRRVQSPVSYSGGKVTNGAIQSIHYHNKVGSAQESLTW